MSDSTAASSCSERTPYCSMAAVRNGAACSAVAHSAGNGAPSQVLEFGEIPSRTSTALLPAVRVKSRAGDGGMAAAAARAAAARREAARVMASFIRGTGDLGYLFLLLFDPPFRGTGDVGCYLFLFRLFSIFWLRSLLRGPYKSISPGRSLDIRDLAQRNE